MRLLLLIILFFPIHLSAQFFYGNTKPDAGYLISETNSTNTGQVLELSTLERFSIAMWVDLQQYACTGNMLVSGDVKLKISTENKRKKIEFSIKDSLRAEGRDLSSLNSDLIEPAQLNTHIVVTYNGTKIHNGLRLYINGTEIIKDTLSTALPVGAISGDSIIIGSGSCKFKYYKIQTYKSVLTAAQVDSLYSDFQKSLSPDKSIFGGEKQKKAGFPSDIYKSWRMMSDRQIISTPFWGDQNDVASSTYQYQSPLSGFFLSPYIKYRAADSTTYIATTLRGGPGFSRDGLILALNHNDSTISAKTRLINVSERQRDDHLSHVITITKDGGLLTLRETVHNGTIDVFKTSFPLPQTLEKTTTAASGENAAYPMLFYLQDSLYFIAREQYLNNMIYKSTDDGATWGAQNSITEVDAGDWNYSTFSIYKDSLLLLFNNPRDQSGNGNYTYAHVLKSTDGINFCDMAEAHCENVTTGVWDMAELNANAAIDSTTDGTSSVFPTHGQLDRLGRAHVIVSNNQTGPKHFVYDGGWTWDSLRYDGITIYPSAFVHVAADTFDCFVIKDNGGYEALMKYQTTDNFESMTFQEVLYTSPVPGSIGIDRVHMTSDYRYGDPVVIAATINLDTGREQTGLFIYHYNPWK